MIKENGQQNPERNVLHDFTHHKQKVGAYERIPCEDFTHFICARDDPEDWQHAGVKSVEHLNISTEHQEANSSQPQHHQHKNRQKVADVTWCAFDYWHREVCCRVELQHVHRNKYLHHQTQAATPGQPIQVGYELTQGHYYLRVSSLFIRLHGRLHVNIHKTVHYATY